MVRVIQREGVQAASPLSYAGGVRSCKDAKIIKQVLGLKRFVDLEMEACEAFDAECPGLVLLYPALSFNALERATIHFYDRLDMGKLAELETADVRSWTRRLPEDDGELYRQVATLAKWSA